MRLFLRFLACAPASRFPSRNFPCIVGRTVGRTRPEYAAGCCCSRRLAPLKMQMSPQHHSSAGYIHFDEHGTAHNFAIVPLRQTNTQQRPRILILTYHGDCPMLIKMRVSGNDGERAPSSEIWIDIIMQKWGT